MYDDCLPFCQQVTVAILRPMKGEAQKTIANSCFVLVSSAVQNKSHDVNVCF